MSLRKQRKTSPRQNQLRLLEHVLLPLIMLTLMACMALMLRPRKVSAGGGGAVNITSFGTAFTQDFDTLPASGSATWANNSTIPAWYHARTGTGTTVVANDGTSNAGNLYSYGTGTNTERALGSIGSGNAAIGNLFWGVRIANVTGSTLTSLTVTYTGEQWRNSAAAAQTVTFSYLIGANLGTTLADFQAAGVNVAALDFTSPITGGAAGGLDGNAAANRTVKSFTISGLSMPNGGEMLLRWSDPDHTGADHGLSIDEFSITANDVPPQPTISVTNVTQAETNAGTTTFGFVVNLSSPAPVGGVTFDIATADGTTNPANAGSDYVARTLTGQTISEGASSFNFDVTVNGDITTEPNETFFVNVTNVTGATPTSVTGLGTINNDDVTLTAIHTIQGPGTASPLVGNVVTTTGIVTGIRQGSSGGFFIQEPDASIDADPNTSEGIFVFTGANPPPPAVIGNLVQVTATVQEFVFASDPNSPPITELSSSPSVNLLTTGNPLPAPIILTAAETTSPSETSNPLDTLEEYEFMRVTIPSLTVCGPSQGSITESTATVASTGVFFGVVTGVPRPFREPGINRSDSLPPGAPGTVPRFDENPERIRVDSDSQPGTTALDVNAGTVITNVTGPLDYQFRTYTILPDAATPPIVGSQTGSTAVPIPTADEVTVASFNMERFFDDDNDLNNPNDPVLTGAAYDRRLDKAELIIRTVQQYPDVIGVQEVENLATLQDVADRLNGGIGKEGIVIPTYEAFLVEGNDIGGIDVGFLVKTSRVSVVDVTQVELAGCDHVTPSTCNNYTNPNNGQLEILNDRPPLVLRFAVPGPLSLGGTFGLTVIVNHMRSLNGIDDAVDGNRVRTKRRAAAEFLANYIQNRQTADPTEKIVVLGDLNAFSVNDGYVDVIGTIKGTPAPASDVTLASSDLVNPDLTNLLDLLPADQRYSYTFDGNAQVLDHIILNHRALVFINRFAYARDDSDFAVKNYESTNELRISDHDQPVAYFNLALDPTADPASVAGRITTPDGSPLGGAVMRLSGAATRTTVTDGTGNYRFENVDTDNFYSVSPSLANYTFSPPSRSFTLTGNVTDAGFTGSPDASQTANAIDTTEYFVRQHYLDFLGREPDQGGLDFWSAQINQCGGDANCIRNKRIDVSAAFFASAEFQQTGSYIYGLYAGTLGRTLNYGEFSADRSQVLGGAGLDEAKQAFAEAFVQRPEFTNRYPQKMTREQFVDAILQTMTSRSGVDHASLRNQLLGDYDTGGRALVAQHASEASAFVAAEYNKAFVLMEYFGYLRRPEDAGGYAFWLDVLNRTAGNHRGMVCAFMTSTEYQARFSTVLTHSNVECGQ